MWKWNLLYKQVFPGSLRPAVSGQLCHRELKPATTWWLPSFASGCGLRPPTASRKQESRADPDAHAAQGSPLVPHKSHLVPQHSFFFLCCLSWTGDCGNPGVDTHSFWSSCGGRAKRPLRVITASQCPLEQPLSYPSSCTGVGARDSAWPRTPATRAGRPAASRLCKANGTLSGWTWDFAAPPLAWFSQAGSLMQPFWLKALQISCGLPSSKLLQTWCFVCARYLPSPSLHVDPSAFENLPRWEGSLQSRCWLARELLDAMQNMDASSLFIFSTKVLFNFPMGKSCFPETSQAFQISFFFVDDYCWVGESLWNKGKEGVFA